MINSVHTSEQNFVEFKVKKWGTVSVKMMSDIPLDRLGSEAGFNETFVTDNQTTPNLPEIAPPDSVLPSPTGPSLSRRITSALCCPCGCETNTQSTPLHQIQPVILRPNNDVYLELKPNRRLRVIHIPPGATLSSSQQNQSMLHPV